MVIKNILEAAEKINKKEDVVVINFYKNEDFDFNSFDYQEAVNKNKIILIVIPATCMNEDI